MTSQRPAIVIAIALLACACNRAPAYEMNDDEKKQAKLMIGFWSSTEDDVGFSGMLKEDGTTTMACGTPIETIKGNWWIASSPLRLVLERKDKSLVEFKIAELNNDSVKLTPVNGGKEFKAQKAAVIKTK